MKYNIVIARTDAKIFEFFDREENIKEENIEDKKTSLQEKVVSYEDIIILNELEVKEVRLVSQGSRLDYEKNKSIEKLKTKVDTDFGLVIEGKIIPTARATYKDVTDDGKKLIKGAMDLDGISKNDLKEMSNVAKISKGAMEALNSALSLKSQASSIWLSTLNRSISNINQLKVWAECYGKYQDKKYPLLSEKVGQVIEEETEEGEKKKKSNLLDYRDVLVTIKISEEHTLQYKFNDLFIGDYTEKFSSGEGIGEYKLQLGQRLINKVDPNNRFTIVETEKVESRLKKLKEMVKDYDGKFELIEKNRKEEKDDERSEWV